MNGKIALGNISWNKSYWHDCSLLVIVRVIAKAITDLGHNDSGPNPQNIRKLGNEFSYREKMIGDA